MKIQSFVSAVVSSIKGTKPAQVQDLSERELSEVVGGSFRAKAPPPVECPAPELM